MNKQYILKLGEAVLSSLNAAVTQQSIRKGEVDLEATLESHVRVYDQIHELVEQYIKETDLKIEYANHGTFFITNEKKKTFSFNIYFH